MRNENLLSFLLIKRRILKLLAIKYAYSLIVLCGISFMACSDDDPVKKNPYLQTSTRAMLKEVVEVVFNNIDSNTDVTVDFGDGTVKEGKASHSWGIIQSTGNLWTGMTGTGMDFPMSRILPGMRRW